ncbi:hypothetical protein [Campylobacter troglodytis]|uniref:hypothetical protein n=1 Tax=Campylobacter troglodytis TaxID=654363 RepID=UPI00115744F5|nr:hypothetical protein [Campylobacter troglodytis]
MSSEKYVNLSDEELKEYFCSQQIPFRHKYPKVSSTLRFKGNLRISWSFDIKHNKNIDFGSRYSNRIFSYQFQQILMRILS